MKWVRDRLPAQQLQHAYAWRSLLAAGVRVAGGSDAPIESCSPFAGIHDAMMRSSRGGAETFKADERLTFAEALYLYTLGAAVASGSEELLGWHTHKPIARSLFDPSPQATSPRAAWQTSWS